MFTPGWRDDSGPVPWCTPLWCSLRSRRGPAAASLWKQSCDGRQQSQHVSYICSLGRWIGPADKQAVAKSWRIFIFLMFHWSPCEDGKKAACKSSECNVEAEKGHLHFLVERIDFTVIWLKYHHSSLVGKNNYFHFLSLSFTIYLPCIIGIRFIFLSPALAANSCKWFLPASILVKSENWFSCLRGWWQRFKEPNLGYSQSCQSSKGCLWCQYLNYQWQND